MGWMIKKAWKLSYNIMKLEERINYNLWEKKE